VFDPSRTVSSWDYSPECVEEKFRELRRKIAHMGDVTSLMSLLT
jgi:hypothetical protein